MLGLLSESAFRAVPRAMVLVALAFGIPLVLTIAAGTAFGPSADQPFIRELGVWARFVFGVGLFILSEQHVEKRLRRDLQHLGDAPLLAPSSMEPAALAVTRALKRRDYWVAELGCLVIASVVSFVVYQRFVADNEIAWAVQSASGTVQLTPAGWQLCWPC